MSEAPKKRWYVVQAFSGFEGRVATSLREHIKLHNMEDLFGEVMVPTEEVVEIRGGQRRKSERKFFPGYVLVQMVMNDASWHLVRSVPRVMGFIGGTSDRPAPISDKEVDAIMNRLQQVGDKPRPKTLFEPGEMVRVNDGPFADFNGVVEEVDYEKSRLKVSVSVHVPLHLSLDWHQQHRTTRCHSRLGHLLLLHRCSHPHRMRDLHQREGQGNASCRIC